jgi:hypothetical protein
VEVVLETVQCSLIDVLVEEADSLRRQAILFGLVHYELELSALLVVLELLFRINFLIIYIKTVVFEVCHDLETCLKIYGSLIIAIAHDSPASLVEPLIVSGHPVVLGKFARSLVECIFVIL